MINKFINVALYRINIHKSISFLYTNREKSSWTPIHNSLKEKQYLGMNLSKEVKGLYSENFKFCRKRKRMTQEDGKTSHAHGLIDLML